LILPSISIIHDVSDSSMGERFGKKWVIPIRANSNLEIYHRYPPHRKVLILSRRNGRSRRSQSRNWRIFSLPKMFWSARSEFLISYNLRKYSTNHKTILMVVSTGSRRHWRGRSGWGNCKSSTTGTERSSWLPMTWSVNPVLTACMPACIWLFVPKNPKFACVNTSRLHFAIKALQSSTNYSLNLLRTIRRLDVMRRQNWDTDRMYEVWRQQPPGIQKIRLSYFTPHILQLRSGGLDPWAAQQIMPSLWHNLSLVASLMAHIHSSVRSGTWSLTNL
jgi:hypothetical protein